MFPFPSGLAIHERSLSFCRLGGDHFVYVFCYNLDMVKSVLRGAIVILLEDILKLKQGMSHRRYVKFHTSIAETKYHYDSTSRYFRSGLVTVHFLQTGQDLWVLKTITAMGWELGADQRWGYATVVLPEYQEYFDRVVVKYHVTSQNMSVKYDSIMDQLEVLEVLKQV